MPALIKSIISFLYVLPLFIFIGCGNVTTFELKKVNTQFIYQTKIPKVPCIFYTKSDTLNHESRNGLCFTFDVDFSGSSGGIEPGIGGTKDSIISFKVFLSNSNERIDITDSLYNLEQSLASESIKEPSSLRCTCYDSIKDLYLNYESKALFNKPTIHTYNKKKNESITYWPNGDSTIYHESGDKIDMRPYETFFTSIKDFISNYNALEIVKKDSLSFKSDKLFNSGKDLEITDFYFWLPDSFSMNLRPNSKIITEIKLSNGDLITHELIVN